MTKFIFWRNVFFDEIYFLTKFIFWRKKNCEIFLHIECFHFNGNFGFSYWTKNSEILSTIKNTSWIREKFLKKNYCRKILKSKKIGNFILFEFLIKLTFSYRYNWNYCEPNHFTSSPQESNNNAINHQQEQIPPTKRR